MENQKTYCAFAGTRLVASGSQRAVAEHTKRHHDDHPDASVLLFDEQSGQQVELDFRGSLADVLAQLEPEPAQAAAGALEPRGPGRPKLGVVSREVSLLPRHWSWLESQQGGASASLRRLVEAARKASEGSDRARQARNAAYTFMSAMTGNLPNFEEATRALYRKDQTTLEQLIAEWPQDLRVQVEKMTRSADRLEREANSIPELDP